VLILGRKLRPQNLIGTPGRLWEIMATSNAALDRVKAVRYLVLDEADRLLSDGHFKEVEQILTAIDKINTDETGAITEERPFRQILVFSATFHKGLHQKLGSKSKYDSAPMGKQESMEYLLSRLPFREAKPKFIDVDPVSQLAEGIKEAVVECGSLEKVWKSSLLREYR